jgi:thiol-disulfide isomerase/thioredoxin
LALSSDAATDLKGAYAKIEKAPDVEVDGKQCTALKLTNRKGDRTTTLLIDPTSHFVRRALTDVSGEMKARGAQTIKKALITIDYTTTVPNAPAKPDAYAWVAPPGAKDAEEMADESIGGPGGTGEVADHILKDKPAPDFKLAGLDDKQVALKDLKGSVVVLDFWATWCGPCVASLPKLDALAKETAAKGVKIFAVNQGEDKELVQGFMKSKKLTVPVLLDDDSKVGNKYKAQAIPETVLSGQDGVVRAVFVGSGSEEGIRKAVEDALR